MKHQFNVKFAGEKVGTAQVSDGGEVVSSDVDMTQVPEKYRGSFDVPKHLDLSDEGETNA